MKNVILSRSIYIVVLLLLPFIAAVSDVSAAEVVLVSNKNVPADSISKDMVKDIFLGKKTTWDNGQKIKFVVLKGSDTHKAFLKAYIKKTPSQFERYWRTQVFTGKGKPPRKFKSEAGLLDYVAGSEGAIGYVSTGANAGSVKIINAN